MKIRIGFEMLYDFPQPTPMIMVLGTHFTRAFDVIVPDFLTTDPVVEITPDSPSFHVNGFEGYETAKVGRDEISKELAPAVLFELVKVA